MGEYLSVRGHRLAEYIHLLDEEREEKGRGLQVIHPHVPGPLLDGPKDGNGLMVWLGDSSRRSGAVTGIGGLAPG
jgi:hypothetical protein